MPKKKLTPLQKMFKLHYLSDMNATGAAIRAGYAVSTANAKAYAWVGESRNDCPENMRHLWDAVKAAVKERADKLTIDADWVLKESVDLLERAKLAKDIPGAKGALDLVGKNVGVLAFQTNHRHAGDPDKPINVKLNATDAAARIAHLLGVGLKRLEEATESSED